MNDASVATWDSASPARRSAAWGALGVSSIAIFLVSIDATVLLAVFGALREGFPSSNVADLSWVLNAYTVVYAALLVPAGRLTDAHGRKRIFRSGLTVFLIASIACGLAPSVGTLVAARVLQAVGAAFLTPSSLSIVLDAFSPERRAFMVSVWGAVSGLAAALGPTIGAGVADALIWRWAFFLNLPLGIVAWWLSRAQLTESPTSKPAEPIDLFGVLLLVGGVGALALGIVESESLGWRSPVVHTSVGGGLTALLCLSVDTRPPRGSSQQAKQ